MFRLLVSEPRPGGWQCRLVIPSEHPCFDGHFQDFPVLPGIAQIALVIEALEEATGHRFRLREIPSVRFRSPVRPGDQLDLRIDAPSQDGRMAFETRRQDQIAAQGTLVVDRIGRP